MIFPLSDALRALPGPNGERFSTLFARGTLDLEIYAPRGNDPQQPHRQDEIYVVVRGSGVFVRGRERYPFSQGDCLFVAAGEVHRFEEFTDDLAVWVIFYGPPGGEVPSAAGGGPPASGSADG